MDSFKNYIVKSTAYINELNTLWYKIAKSKIEQDADEISNYLNSAKDEIKYVFKQYGVCKTVQDDCLHILDNKHNLINAKIKHINSIEIVERDWFVEHEKNIANRNEEYYNAYYDLCKKKVRLRLWHVIGFIIALLLLLGYLLYLIIPYIISLLEMPKENIGKIGLFGYYFEVALMVILLALIVFCGFRYIPKMWKKASKFWTLFTMIKTDSTMSNINIQRELELIMKS